MEKAGLQPRIMIDFSHANSSKDYRRQSIVCRDVAGQIASGDKRIMGVMIESSLVAGCQPSLSARPRLRPKHHRRLPRLAGNLCLA